MSRQLNLSVYLTNFAATDPGSWAYLLDTARAADQCGVDRLVVSDHVIMGEQLDEYGKPAVGGVAGGKQPTGPDGPWLEPLTLLSVVAGATSTVRLGTAILLAALRRPVVLAKTLSTLDVLSEGRLDLGVGVGWQREEYQAAGLPFERRGRLLDHTLEVCQTLWREQSASYHSDELDFAGIHLMPKPRQPGGVPIWVSGTINARTVARLARFGTGWIPWGKDAEDLAVAIPRIKDEVAAAGGDASDLGVWTSLALRTRPDGTIDADATMSQLAPLVDAGATDFRIGIPNQPDFDAASETLTPLVAAFRSAVGRAAVS